MKRGFPNDGGEPRSSKRSEASKMSSEEGDNDDKKKARQCFVCFSYRFLAAIREELMRFKWHARAAPVCFYYYYGYYSIIA
jgi:hypothetical protein